MGDRREAFAALDALLAAQGNRELRAEMRRVQEELDAHEAHRLDLAEIARSMLQSEKTYRLVFGHELDAMVLCSPEEGTFLDVNDSWLKLYGYTREEALKLKVTDISAEPLRAARALGEVAFEGGKTQVDVRWHRAKDGTVFPVELTAGRLVLDGREVVYEVARDITQRHNAQILLARSEASYRALIESMPDAVIVHRLGTVVFMSPSARRMLGYGLDDNVVGMSALELVHPDDRSAVIERVLAMLTHGSAAPFVEERLLRRDGSHVVTECAALNTIFDGESSVLVIARDITARKEIEAQLVMNDRLASLGRLAASVGHELNNPLAYVLGNVGLMERELTRSEGLPAAVAERFARYLQVLGEGARRMRDIVHDLKTLARADSDDGSPIDVQQLLDVCANMAEHEIRPRSRLVKDYRDRVSVFGTETRLGQVFLNLLVNAGQSIPVGAAADHEVRIIVRRENDRAVIEISDTGCGIAPELRERIFEPFFTTKEGTGTGLGLAISHRIVTSARGTLTCEPGPRGGTSFRVVLPSADAERSGPG